MKDDLLSSLSEETNFEMKKGDMPAKSEDDRGENLRRDLFAEDYRERHPNVYEAIIVMARRARQIGDKQAKTIEQFMASKAKSEEEEDEEVYVKPSLEDDDEDVPKMPKFEKPTILAMNELYRDELQHKYEDK